MPILGGCRRRLRAVNEALETATSPSLKRLRRENDNLLARVSCLEAKMEAGAEERLLLDQRVLQLTELEQYESQEQEAAHREEVLQLRERVARAGAAQAVARAATEERSKLESNIGEEKTKADLLEMENVQLERQVEEHHAEREALQTEKHKFEEERRSVERKLADKSRRSMISRACFEKKLRSEREENDQLQQQLSEALNNNEALQEGTRQWEEWASGQLSAGGAASSAAALPAHPGAQPRRDLAQSDEELVDVGHPGDLDGADLLEDLGEPRHRVPL